MVQKLFISPGGGLIPGTSLFSILLSPALLLPPAVFFLAFFQGFCLGSCESKKVVRDTKLSQPSPEATARPASHATRWY